MHSHVMSMGDLNRGTYTGQFGFVYVEPKSNPGNYDLEVVMNLARNVWSATLNDAVLVNSKAITTQGFALNFGDADAVWVIRTPGSPGDNFMLFDDYTVSVESVPAIPPRLRVLASDPRQAFALRILGEAGRAYVIDASPDMKLWTPIKTNTSLDGTFDLVDLGSPGAARRFYRARLY